MFSPEERREVAAALTAAASSDSRLSGVALLGSAAVGREDRWSDVDLAIAVEADEVRRAVISDWTVQMYDVHGAAHHLDVIWGDVLYRVFLLSSGLQVDLSFWPANEFRPVGPKFRLLFGEAQDAAPRPPPVAEELIGWAWLYAVHARSSIGRSRVWQAEYMISGARDQVLSLACLRHGVPAEQGRGIDDLPADVLKGLNQMFISSLDVEDLEHALRATTAALLTEAEYVDTELARRLAEPIGNIGGLPV